jgi:hypothetical protein
MKKLSSIICVLGITAALVTGAAPASAKGGAAENCGAPPGQIVRELAKFPGSTRQNFDGPPGQFVSQVCAPGHQDEGGI